jgi:ABC-2 type transport system ATP-binding protein
MLRCKAVHKVFGNKKVLSDVNIRIESGTVYALLGINGSGKTTLLNILSGVLPLDRSEFVEIEIKGVSLLKDAIHYKRLLGYVPSKPFFYEELTVRENLSFIAGLYGLNLENTLYKEFIKMFSLDEDMFLKDLSLGQRQKVSIIAAVLHEPEVLLLDEATIGLDPQSMKIFKVFLNNLKKQGKIVIFATHILELAQIVADDFGVLHTGTIIHEGKIEELLKFPMHPKFALENLFLKLTGGEKYKKLLQDVENIFSNIPS